jgi:hypothetical protein
MQGVEPFEHMRAKRREMRRADVHADDPTDAPATDAEEEEYTAAADAFFDAAARDRRGSKRKAGHGCGACCSRSAQALPPSPIRMQPVPATARLQGDISPEL